MDRATLWTWLAAASVLLQAGASEVAVLPVAGPQAAAAVAVLQALRRGDPAPLLALPPETLVGGAALPDPLQPDLYRQWARLLPAAAERHPPALAAVEQALAGCVPQRAADRAFDRGRFEDFLDQLWSGASDPRRAVALALAGWSGAGELPEPGLPLAASRPPVLSRDAAGWRITAHWLLRLGADGRIAWQIRRAPGERVLTGAGAAVLAGERSARIVDADGSLRRLPPLPAMSQAILPVAVGGGGVWFNLQGSPVAWRSDLDTGEVLRLVLPEPPLAAPLIHGLHAWWLGRTTMARSVGAAVAGIVDHGLPVDGGWRLTEDRSGISLGDGTSWWRVPSLADSLAEETERDRTNLSARHFAAVSSAGGLGLRAALGMSQANDPALDRLARTPRDRALLAAARAPVVAGQRRIDPAQLSALGESDWEISLDPADALWRDSSAWRHRLTSRGWRLNQHSGDVPQTAGSGPVRSVSEPWSQEPLGLVLRRGRDQIVIDAPGRWRSSWDAGGFLAAPVVGIEIRGQAVVVSEGEGRALVLDAGSGVCLADLRPSQLTLIASQVAVLTSLPALVQVGPLGVGTRIEVLSPTGETSAALPRPARWVAGLGREAVIAFTDGTAAVWPGMRPVALPADLLNQHEPPVATRQGLVAGGRCWPWAAGAP
ncbi:hypothetical protein LBMAG53_15990 [Planctomycetota bacterium]|nr:hypothetical protein LBMAG53_15990 [Planctomycetota bacterium]